ncbi:hypothetical protein ART_3160 [Arthrobacter sp. PAMC 25486]|nr:hypothetical protein ART_3160 [Arthrobacter sp. PAMC 25486]
MLRSHIACVPAHISHFLRIREEVPIFPPLTPSNPLKSSE